MDYSDRHYLSKVLGSTLGTQEKTYENGFWYKQDQKGYEGLAEELASRILSVSNSRWIFSSKKPGLI